MTAAMAARAAPDQLDETRRWFADDLRVIAAVTDADITRAFAAVPRERFLPQPPWRILHVFENRYWTSDDPRDLYHNVAVAIDPERGLNNGEPGLWARLFDRLKIAQGERVIQIGAGAGYFTAVLAEIVGAGGTVTAYEIDDRLAARAAEALKPWPQAKLIHGDGSALAGPADAIVAFCGTTHPPAPWLDALAEGGRLLLPLTSAKRLNAIARLERRGDIFDARSLGWIGIYPCAGMRDEAAEERLVSALARGWPQSPVTLRRDAHMQGPHCWLHGTGYCFQRASTEAAPTVH